MAVWQILPTLAICFVCSEWFSLCAAFLIIIRKEVIVKTCHFKRRSLAAGRLVLLSVTLALLLLCPLAPSMAAADADPVTLG